LNQFGHLVAVAESIYAGAHSDFEFPCRNLIFHAGVRLEWSYTWSNILQQVSDSQDIALFLTVGIRY
jgi:hypothetical protein